MGERGEKGGRGYVEEIGEMEDEEVEQLEEEWRRRNHLKHVNNFYDTLNTDIRLLTSHD